ncbi:MAG: cytochrome [Acidimicrobiaceae bacterium]|nr:cytochrome [Acidimicrobiaceae bacterium]
MSTTTSPSPGSGAATSTHRTSPSIVRTARIRALPPVACSGDHGCSRRPDRTYDPAMANGERLDLLDGGFYVSDPYPTYAWMREHEPFYWDPHNELWGVSRYDDIVTIERDKERFTNSGNEKGGYRPNIRADSSIIGLDDPHHTVRRNVVSRRFTPRAAGDWEEHVREVVTDLLDGLAETGEAEVVSQLAAPLPAQMIGLLLGFPHDSWPKLKEWSERTIALGGGPRYHDEDGVLAVFEFTEAVVDVYERTRAERAGGGCPADSVMDVWVDKEVEGLGEYPFGLDQIIPDCLLLLDGGAETTRTVIARTLVELTRRPDQFQLLVDGADLTVAVEEFIRWVTPIHNMCRIATEDVEFGDVTVGAGQQVVLMYSSANRDPAHFDDPESFEVTRQPNHHLAFGHGTHFCLGAALARLEIRVFFEEFVRRFRNPRLAPGTEPVEMPNAFVHGLREAHLVVDPT